MFDLKTIWTKGDESPKDYVLNDPGLKRAVDMAIWLQKPLLITGAPGTGKTRLAAKVAYELAQLSGDQLKDQFDNHFSPFIGTPFVFNTKTVSSASELFYYYDAIGHFRERPIDSEMEEVVTSPVETKVVLRAQPDGHRIPAYKYIELNALGKAIAQTWGQRKIVESDRLRQLRHLNKFQDLDEEPKSSVVLIDEIDKATRDFPNDLLNEIENMEFRIRELNQMVERNPDSPARIVVIMTSNFERNLPDAFLRRCLFYHIHAPTEDKLLQIVCTRMESYLRDTDTQKLQEKYRPIVKFFQSLGKDAVERAPATSELLEWIKVLELEGFFMEKVDDFSALSKNQRIILHYSLPILVKSKEDMEKMTRKYPLPDSK